MNELMTALLLFIDANTSLTPNNALSPEIITSVSFIPNANTHEIYSGVSAATQAQEVLGLYVSSEQRIYLSKNVDLSTVFGKSILLHELVHHIQHTSPQSANVYMGRQKSCFAKFEKQAYAIQNLYLKSHGNSNIISEEHIEMASNGC